jgi:hypothetical protein
MAKSSRERQQEYRDRQRRNETHQRLDLWISSEAYSALERLTRHCKTTKRDVIERLVIILDTDVCATAKLEESQWDAYFNQRRLHGNEMEL